MLQAPWREVARLYRLACWHSSQSRDAEANELLHGAFAEALARANVLVPFAEDELQTALNLEADRVANAVALHEVMDGQILPARDFAAAAPVLPRSPAGGDDVRGIADFIEDMLLQDRPQRGAGGR